ncbi:MAG: arsenite methyltransferase [Dehalococcoidia bacterium]|nr:arsenite methyltransferase [Dehalococcoidia bacterium]
MIYVVAATCADMWDDGKQDTRTERKSLRKAKIKDGVKERYAQIASQEQQPCCCSCSCDSVGTLFGAEEMGYSREDLERIPKEAIMGLGCGSPTAVASLKKGEVVLDLGSGAGVDVFIAAEKVGPKGKVIGVDITKEMVNRAKRLAKANGYKNVDFRLGEIEKLPVEDGSVDIIISNCVINLSTDKDAVFREAFRVLKPGGRLTISDIVSEKRVPAALRDDVDAWSACIAGALQKSEYLRKMADAGFGKVQVTAERDFYVETVEDGKKHKFLSVTVKAYKPKTRRPEPAGAGVAA